MNKINCPACGHDFHAEEVITKHLAKDFEQNSRERNNPCKPSSQPLDYTRTSGKKFEQKKKLNELFNDRVERNESK